MQYIECIHCGKRYAANRKFREAMGRKKVRCTSCGKSFLIIVYDAKPVEGEATDPAAGDAAASSN